MNHALIFESSCSSNSSKHGTIWLKIMHEFFFFSCVRCLEAVDKNEIFLLMQEILLQNVEKCFTTLKYSEM